MKDKEIPDFTAVYKKIFTMARDLRSLRRAFPHSRTDARAERDRRFIEKWRRIAGTNGEAR